jgi:hypothetical protein
MNTPQLTAEGRWKQSETENGISVGVILEVIPAGSL